MFDLRWLRDNAELFDASLRRRGQGPAAARLLELDAERRKVETELGELQAKRNKLAKEFPQMLRAFSQPGVSPTERNQAISDHSRVGDQLKDEVRKGEERLRELQARLDAELASYPNVLADDVPDGPDERDNRLERTIGTPRQFNFKPLQHDEIGAKLGMSFEKAARISGARFVALFGQMARLERAIAAFMLDIQTRERGYTEVAVPLLVRDNALFGTGQLPKFAEDQFRTTSDHWLIPTAEVPLTNMVAGELLAEEQLPIRYTACSPCFRSEAGAAGKDTKGMIRQHQFMKVELVSITTPEQSEAEHQRMTASAELVLQRLELPYRVMTLCAGDIGFGARKTFDIEVWLPGQDCYREISSCSNCGDFQARRMNARFRPKEGKGTRFVHTLNGSGLAVGRTLVAVLENYQEADGSVRVPTALLPYTGGLEQLQPEG